MSYPVKANAAVDTEASLGTNSLFEQPWWLDAVAPGAWGAVEVSRDGRVVARLLTVIEKFDFEGLVAEPVERRMSFSRVGREMIRALLGCFGVPGKRR